MRLKVLALVFALMATGCTVKTQIIEPDGSTYTVRSKSDALVTMKTGEREITVDNRGQPNIFQSIVEYFLLKTPDVVSAN